MNHPKPALTNKSVICEKVLFFCDRKVIGFNPYHQLVYIECGTGTFACGGSKFTYNQSNLFLIPPNLPYVFDAYPSSEVSTGISINFCFDKVRHLIGLPEFGEMISFFSRHNGGFFSSHPHIGDVRKRLRLMLSVHGIDLIIGFISLIKKITEIKDLKPLLHHDSPLPYKQYDLRIQKIYEYVNLNIQDSISLATISDVANMNPNAFCRYFKQEFGCSFVTFLNSIRINVACNEIIARGQKSTISQIASEVGFNSITNFNKVFKAKTGLTPKEYLNNWRTSVFNYGSPTLADS